MAKAKLGRRLFLGASTVGGAAWLQGCAHAQDRTAPLVEETPATVLPPGLFGPTEGVARLSYNENPYGPSPRVYAALEEAARSSAYYVDTTYIESMLAERHGITGEQVTVSHGSAEALNAISLAWGRTAPMLGPDLFFDFPAGYAVRQGMVLRRVPMADGLAIDLKGLEAAIDGDTSIVHICNPNNPTGRLLDPDELRAFCRRVGPNVTVLVDEAYNELTSDPEKNSMMDLVRAGENVIVARTFSKIYGMAGMRIGYVMSRPDHIATIKSHLMSWVSAPSVAAAVAAYDDETFLRHSKAKILEGRDMVSAAVKAAGLEHLPAEGNFLFVNVGDADLFQKKMEARKIMVRGAYGDYRAWSRVSMGRLEDLERYVRALPEVLEEMSSGA